MESPERFLNVVGDIRVQALWEKQHYLAITSILGDPIGSGWFGEGTIATFGVDLSGMPVGNQLRGYSLDGAFFSESEGRVLMDSPHFVTFQWSEPGQSFGSIYSSDLDLSSLAMSAGGAGMLLSSLSLGLVHLKGSERVDDKQGKKLLRAAFVAPEAVRNVSWIKGTIQKKLKL